MKYMLDTNICIYAIKNKPEKVLEKFKENLQEGLCISVITLAELEYGVEKSSNPERNTAALLQFVSLLVLFLLTMTLQLNMEKPARPFCKKGTPIGTMDS